jgi:site-specific DNA-methyltransferase (adenine-specific)
MKNQIILGDNLKVLPTIPDKSVRLIYVDPPFNTGKTQKRERISVKAVGEGEGDRVGFGGKEYQSEKIESASYEDSFDNFEEFLMPRIEASLHTLTDDGSIFVHLDYREVHYIKVAMDKLLGRDHFMNEIIWAFDYGARSKTRWPAKHNNILWYAMNPENYVFNFDAMERIPYMAPGLVGEEKAERGKTPTDTWFHTIVATNGKEKTGYPTQKPLGVVSRIVKVHSNPGDLLMDFFAGSGTLGEGAGMNERYFTMIDSNEEAVKVMESRLEKYKPEIIESSKIK